MLKGRKKFYLKAVTLLAISVFFLGPIFQNLINQPTNDIYEQPLSLHTSETYSGNDVILPDGWYHWKEIGFLYSGDKLHYNFYTNDSSVKLHVYLLEEDEFDDKYDGYSYSIHENITSSYDWASGDAYVQKSDTFYMIFETIGFDCELSYTINTYPSTPPPNFTFIFMAIFISLVVIVFVGVAISIFVQKNRFGTRTIPSKMNPYRTRTPPITTATSYDIQPTIPKPESQPDAMKSNIGYCKYCGEKTEIDAIFCPQCGSKF